MNKDIPFFKAPTQPLRNLGKEFDEILSSGILIKGKYNRLFEEKLKEYLNVKNVILVSSGTIGLTYLFKLLNPNKVYMPSFTFGATATSATWSGIKNIEFIDIDSRKWTLSSDSLEEKIVDKNSLIVPVNLFGNPCDFDYIKSIAEKSSSKIIYDAAHSLGSFYKGYPVGSQGDAQVFSLSPTKVLTSAEGGIISTNDDNLAEELRWMVEWGHKGDYNTIIPGLNARMSEVHALIGYESLLIIDELFEKRNSQVELYKNKLNKEYFTYQEIEDNSVSTFKDFAIVPNLINSREERNLLISHLSKNKINVKTYFDPPIHKHDFYNAENKNLPITESLSDQIICLPVFYSLENSEIEFICKVLNEFFS
jgi:dTDP-4-amino-4,6-dideoxygalactose transaminase